MQGHACPVFPKAGRRASPDLGLRDPPRSSAAGVGPFGPNPGSLSEPENVAFTLLCEPHDGGKPDPGRVNAESLFRRGRSLDAILDVISFGLLTPSLLGSPTNSDIFLCRISCYECLGSLTEAAFAHALRHSSGVLQTRICST